MRTIGLMFLFFPTVIYAGDSIVPKDAKVEMDAKVAAGYYTDSVVPGPAELAMPKGRALAPGVVLPGVSSPDEER